ncbi:MAG: electron transfer flavoprotein subunit alpha/FixB family protein [Gemmatimonadaceae bacterium]
MANVLAFAESRGGELRRVALEAVTAARSLADAQGGEVHALLLGPPGIAGKAEALGRYGADVVLVVEHPGLANHSAEVAAATAAARARDGGYVAVVFSSSAQGKDLAPRVAAKLGLPLAADAIGFNPSADGIRARHPGYASKVVQTLTLTARPAVLSLRPGAVTPAEKARSGRVEAIPPAIDPASSRVVVKEMVQGRSGRPDLTDAPVVISGGRGLRAADNFKLVEELADAFGNAAVGCTRAVADDGWRPQSDQIGQTGRTVSPELYVAVGISGAIQHLAGMRTAKTIVAINRDKEAPIFKVADYGIVGDALEIVPALTAAVRDAKKAH